MNTPLNTISYAIQLLIAYTLSFGAESKYEYTASFTGIDIIPSNFNMYASCSKSIEQPKISNYSIILPFGSDNADCPFNFIDAVTNLSYTLNTFKFNGTFKGVNTAPNELDEIVVFATNDINNYTSQEMGFRLSMKDNILYGYIQDGTGEPEGWTQFKNVIIDDNPDQQEHEYLVKVREHGMIRTFYFYIDTELKGKIFMGTPSEYYNVGYHVVATTHRRENGWDCDGSCLIVKGIKFK